MVCYRASPMTRRLPIPLLLFSTSLVIFLIAVGGNWIWMTPGGEELYGDTGRYVHEFKNLFLSGNVSWWSSNFLSGHSSTAYLNFLFPSVAAVISSSIFGDWIGLKMVMLLFLALSSCGVYLLAFQLGKDHLTAFLAATLSLLSPQILLRVSDFEHYHSVICVSLMPMVLWSVARMVESPSLRLRVFSGVVWAGMLVSYSKLALMFLPVFLLFFLFLILQTKQDREKTKQLLTGVGISLVVAFFCGGVFLLPLAREYQWFSLFSPSELAGWQKSFSIKSLICLIDRNNFLTQDMPDYFRADRGQFYLGAITVPVLVAVFRLSGPGWMNSLQGKIFRMFLAMALFSLWLCHGPFSPFTGAVEFLKKAQRIPDWLPAFVWLVTFLPGLLIFAIFPRIRYWQALAGGVTLIFYLVPGFLILEALPLYSNIRAPWGFWEVSYYTIPIALAFGGRHLFSTSFCEPRKRISRLCFLFLISVAILFDASGYLKNFFQQGLPEELYADFTKTNEKLEESPVQGSVYPVSGRYFDLRVPFESGRRLCTEASWAHFKMKPYSEMFKAAHHSTKTLSSYYSIGGVSHMLVDKKSPFLPRNFQTVLSKTFEQAHDSDHIALWENIDSLSPGFLAKNYIAVDEFDPKLIEILFEVSSWLPAVGVQLTPGERNMPFLVGEAGEGKMLSINTDTITDFPLKKIPYSTKRTSSTEFEFAGAQGDGESWLVTSEAWHPDWKAYGQSGELVIRRAFGGIMAVWITPQDGNIRFSFRAPFWYNVAVFSGIFSLVVASLYLVTGIPSLLGRLRISRI